MKRKHLGFLILLIVASIASIIVYKIVYLVKHKQERKASISHLPDLSGITANRNVINIKNSAETGSVIISVVNTECDFCHEQIKEFQKMITAKTLKIFLLSTEPLGQLQDFASRYAIPAEGNITIAQISPDDLYRTFGSVATPYTTLYVNGTLVTEFKTNTTSENIVKYIENYDEH